MIRTNGYVERRSSGRQVADHIRGLIFSGALRQGDRVRQDMIAEDLGVSRIPVREAMITLESEGWITIEPHRGAFVHGLDRNSVVDFYALLGELYGLAAERATERGTPEELAAITEAAGRVLAAEEADDIRRANETFLRLVFAMADSPRLSSFSRLMTGLIPGNFFAVLPNTIQPHKQGVDAVTRAMTAGDGRRAADEFVRLLRGAAEHVVALFDDRDILWRPAAG